jgi:hypothetical protein
MLCINALNTLKLKLNFKVPEAGKKFLGSRERPARKVDNLAAICEPIV